MKEVQAMIESKLKIESYNNCNQINESVLKLAIDKVVLDKTDPIANIKSNNLRFGSELLFTWCTIFYKACISHGYLPLNILLATILPLVKDKKGDLEDSGTYRSICISSVMLKILDWVILILHGQKLESDELQFGYVRNSNMELAT